MLNFTAKPTNTPSGIKIEDVNSTAATIVFTQVPESNRAVAYDIEITDTVAQNTTIVSMKHIKLTVGPRSKQIIGFAPETGYRIRLLAVNSVGKGPWSGPVTFTTLMGKKLTHSVLCSTLGGELK